MSPGQVIACYRLYAAHCIEIARELPGSGRKIALLNMAQVWIALADEAERKASVEVLIFRVQRNSSASREGARSSHANASCFCLRVSPNHVRLG